MPLLLVSPSSSLRTARKLATLSAPSRQASRRFLTPEVEVEEERLEEATTFLGARGGEVEGEGSRGRGRKVGRGRAILGCWVEGGGGGRRWRDWWKEKVVGGEERCSEVEVEVGGDGVGGAWLAAVDEVAR